MMTGECPPVPGDRVMSSLSQLNCLWSGFNFALGFVTKWYVWGEWDGDVIDQDDTKVDSLEN